MALKEVAVYPQSDTTRSRELGQVVCAVRSAFDSQLRRHPVNLGCYLKVNVVLGNNSLGGPLPLFEKLERVAVVNLPPTDDDIAEFAPSAQAETLLGALVQGIAIAADRATADVDIDSIIEHVRSAGFRTEVTQRRRNRARTRYGTFRGLIGLERTVLTLTVSDAKTGEVLLEEERRAFADHWDLTHYARALRWDDDELVIESNPLIPVQRLNWRMRVP